MFTGLFLCLCPGSWDSVWDVGGEDMLLLLLLFCCLLVFLLLNLIIIVFLFFCVCDILCIVQRRYPGIMYGTRVERTARDKQTNSCTCRIPPRLLVKYPDKVNKTENPSKDALGKTDKRQVD